MVQPTNNWSEHFWFISGAAIIFVLLSVCLVTATNFKRKSKFYFQEELASSHENGEGYTLSLKGGWEFTTTSDDLSLAQLSASNALSWQPFVSSHAHSDRIEGHFWLRKRFKYGGQFTHPALVLGAVNQAHRLYVNGSFVGGSDYWADVATYPVAPVLLRVGEENEILMKGFSPRNPYPALRPLSPLGTQMGEIGDIQRIVIRDRLSFYVARPIYIIVTLIAALIAMGFLAFNRDKKHLYYVASYLLLGAIILLYDDFFVNTANSYRLLMFMKAFSLGTSPFILSALFWRLRGLDNLELVSNVGGLLYGAATCSLLMQVDTPVSESHAYFKSFFGVSLLVAFTWMAYGLIDLYRKRKTQLWPMPHHQHYALVTFVCGALGMLSLYHSAGFTSESVFEFVVKSFGNTHPAWLAFAFLALMAREHALDSRNSVESAVSVTAQAAAVNRR